MKEPTPPAPDDDPDARDDDAIAALVGRIRRADDPTAALLRPLSDAERGAMAERVLGSLAPARGAEVLPLRAPAPARRTRPLLWALPLAASFLLAVLSLLVGRGAPPLVAYHLTVEGDAELRGDEPASEAPVSLRPETKLRVRLAPDAPARDVALRLVVVRDRKATVLSPPALVDGQGGFTIEAAAGKLLGEQVDGAVELVFALGRPLPEDDALARLAIDPKASPPASVRLARRAALLVGFSPKHGSLGWSGCRAVRVGPICEVDREHPVHIWAEGADPGRFSVRLDDREVSVRPVPVEGGLRWSVPPAGARALALHLAGREVLRLPLAEAPPSPVAAAEALRRDGKLDEAEASLNEAERDPAARLLVLRARARIEARRGRAARAAALREQAIVAERAEGRISFEVDDQLARVHELIYQDHALAEARRRLDGLPAPAPGDAEHQVKVDYYLGLLAGEAGDVRTALAALGAARRGARRFVMPSYEAGVTAPLSDALSSLGRDDEAAALLAEVEAGLDASGDRCDRAAHVMNHGAVLLRIGRVDEAERRLRDAARLAQGGCPRVLADVLTNLAFARRDEGALADARALLGEARAVREGPGAWMDVWEERLRVELLLGGDPRAALAAAEKVRRAAETSLSPELLFDAAFGRARALVALGDAVSAASAWASAEEALDVWGTLVPLGEGRQGFLDRQERAPRAWLDLLLREASRPGARPEATAAVADAARRSVARFYRVLGDLDRASAPGPDEGQATAAYRLARARIEASLAGGSPPAAADLAAVRARRTAAPRVAFAPPGEGELVLVFHPLPEGWLGVAVSPTATVARRLGRVDPHAGPAALSAALLEPFRDLLARARSVRVQAHRALGPVSFQALPWDGRPLLDRLPVVLGLDAGAPPARSAACAGPPSALLVADARENLAGAGAAATDVEAALRARGLEVRLLRGDQARLDPVRRALADPCLQVFHYEGHAVFEGRDGVGASLLLADGRLTATDILQLPAVPPVAVLSGCSTAEADGLGLAQAFLARGSAEVLATVRPVPDATAAAVARHLHAPASPTASLAAAWQATFSRLSPERPSLDGLDAYRVFGR